MGAQAKSTKVHFETWWSAMSSPAASDIISGGDELGRLLEMRQHVKHMRSGTPLLLHTTVHGKDDMQIGTFWVNEDLQLLKWTLQENGDDFGPEKQVPINAIVSVKDDGQSLKITLRDGGKMSTMGLTCASQEDRTIWRDGLRFLRTLRSPASINGMNTQLDECRQRVRQQEEMIAKLTRENAALQESVKRKDLAITKLTHDLRSQSGTMEYCHKTESTSRESDEHLRYREMAILKRKNQRLRKLVQTKQQTISELSQLLRKVLEHQNGSSAAEDSDSDGDADVVGQLPVAGDLDSSDPEAIREEMRVLSGALERLERDVGSLPFFPPGRNQGQEGRVDAKSSVNHSISDSTHRGNGAGPFSTNGDQLPTADTLVSRPRPASSEVTQIPQRFDFSAITGTALSSQTVESLQVLAQEMETLEAKKRIVEQLSKHLEPSDGEEDDGFPWK